MARILHCYAEGRDGDWEAICLELDVAVQGGSFEEVFRSLREAIALYLETVADLRPTNEALAPSPGAVAGQIEFSCTWARGLFLGWRPTRQRHAIHHGAGCLRLSAAQGALGRSRSTAMGRRLMSPARAERGRPLAACRVGRDRLTRAARSGRGAAHIVRYVSTRGGVPPCGFEAALFAGLAADGGLYLPERWPRLERDELEALQGASYQEVAGAGAGAVRRRGSEPGRARRADRGGLRGFDHAAIAPLAPARAERVAARAVPRADARLQGRRHAAAGAPVRAFPRAAAGGRSRSSARPRATPAPRRSRPSPGARARRS